ncbi:unnamed protein product, partial [Ectocarpus sp. 4 AP-2014]
RFEAIPDKKKLKRACIPNFIHHIYLLLLQLVVIRFREHSKPIFTVHDAFYVTLNDINFIKEYSKRFRILD